MDFDQILSQQGAWLRGDGLYSDTVVFSRVRLARSISGYPFPCRMSEADAKRFLKAFEEASQRIFSQLCGDTEIYRFDLLDGSQLDAYCLAERQLITPRFMKGKFPRSVWFDADETFSLMLNEDDHIRIQAFASGLNVPAIRDKASALDDLLEDTFPPAFDSKLGYLTACPSNVGTGLRLYAVLFLPGIAKTEEIDRLNHALQQLGYQLAVFRQKSRSKSRPKDFIEETFNKDILTSGYFYQLCSQTSLGVTEEEIYSHFRSSVELVCNYEAKAREYLLDRDRGTMIDQTERALGILSRARQISLDEAMKALARVRLGLHFKLQSELSLAKINSLTLHIQQAHMQKLARKKLSDEEAAIFRADYLRSQIH